MNSGVSFKYLRTMPESLKAGGAEYHESCFKSYQILEKAKVWLAAGTPGFVVLEMIEDAYSERPPQHKEEQ